MRGARPLQQPLQNSSSNSSSSSHSSRQPFQESEWNSGPKFPIPDSKNTSAGGPNFIFARGLEGKGEGGDGPLLQRRQEKPLSEAENVSIMY